MGRSITIAVSAIALCLTGCGTGGNPQAEKAARVSTEEWLKLVDSGRYAESWDAAAGYFKDAVEKGQWEKQAAAARKPLGEVFSRKLKSKRYRTSLPGVPDGEYVVIRFQTSFANKKSAIETVTPMLDKDGIWRVSGYFIR